MTQKSLQGLKPLYREFPERIVMFPKSKAVRAEKRPRVFTLSALLGIDYVFDFG